MILKERIDEEVDVEINMKNDEISFTFHDKDEPSIESLTIKDSESLWLFLDLYFRKIKGR